MAGTALPGRLTWRVGAVVELVEETPFARTIVMDVEGWPGHEAGQHVDVRLTAEDGYQAQRSYSIASAPEDGRVELTVERLADGEVSTYLVDELAIGDVLELRGPIGGYFVWNEPMGGPLLLLAGGSGIVPLRSILRHHSAANSEVPVRLLYSTRGQDQVLYRAELDRVGLSDDIDVRYVFTRSWPSDWHGYRHRIDHQILSELAWLPSELPLTYVCGPTGFVEAAANILVELGHVAGRIKTERFGPSGG